LEEYLMHATSDDKLRRLMLSMAEAVRTIAYRVRTASTSGTASMNSYGDEQLAVDLLADKILFESLKFSNACSQAVSEEVPEPVHYENSDGGYSVAFDPLDGSSIVDCNFSVGTIFGVWPGNGLEGQTGRNLSAAGMGVYGPRSVFVVAMEGEEGAHEFMLGDDGKWVCNKVTSSYGEGKMFAPGNLRAITSYNAYNKLVQYYIDNGYTLRYSGGLVPDVFQLIVKEKGVFTNVKAPNDKAKLRLTFEVSPIAYLIEKAGGYSSANGLQKSALDVPINNVDERAEICFGSKDEVKRFEVRCISQPTYSCRYLG
jgi:sedoheptulose-bisphosphatase